MNPVEYTIDENDHLQFQLFNASKSPAVQKRRTRSKHLIPAVYIILGVFISMIEKSPYALIFFFVVGVLWYLFYPGWESKRYLTFYRNYIQENNEGNLPSLAHFEFGEGWIFVKGDGMESKIAFSQFTEINETENYIFLKLKAGLTYIFPLQKIQEREKLKEEFKTLAQTLKIRYNTEKDWVWK